MDCVRSLCSHSLHWYGHAFDSPWQPNRAFSSRISLPSSWRIRNGFKPSLNVLDNPHQKSNYTCGFSGNKPVIDISSVYSRIQEYTDNGLFGDAIRAYLDLLDCGFGVEEFKFFPLLIKAFGGLCDIIKAKEIHGHLVKLGALDDSYVNNSLLNVYWKCGAVEQAVKMFEKLPEKDLVSWNTMVSGFCQSGDCLNSLRIFRRMVNECGSLYLNRVSCVSALSSCASFGALNEGREIHGFLVKNGLDADELLVSGLIEMYMKCGEVKNAENVFNGIFYIELLRVNRVIWNVMILGYVSNECPSLALELFNEMLELGIFPDSSTMVAVLVLCSQLLDLGFGKQIHGVILGFGLENDIRIETALMEMYFRCGDPDTGLTIFRRSQNRNLVMWGSVMSNCVQSSYRNEALQLFCNFVLDGGFADSITLLAALRACSSLALRTKGMEFHGLALKGGFDSNVFVGGALVDMYGKCGDMNSAGKVFHRIQTRDLVSWNALISGFAQNESPYEALKAFRDMQSKQIKPNSVTVACILSVCSHLPVMILCKEVHCYLLRHGFEHDILVSNSLTSAYAKCGDMNSSWRVFEKLPARNQVSWNSIMLGLGMHCHIDQMLVIFEEMKEAGMKPDHQTFTALLSACSHAGNVDMGWKYFNSMVEDYNLEPRIEQYTCMVDLLGRAGHLNQAYNLIMEMPCSPDDRIWGSLLGSCKNHGDAKLAKIVANRIFGLNPTSTGYRVLLANLYEDSGKWSEVNRVRSEIKDIGLKKEPGCSWIEVNNTLHKFTAGGCLHDQSRTIYSTIENLMLVMKSEGGYTGNLHSASPVTYDGGNCLCSDDEDDLCVNNFVT